ncbi:MAG: RNA-binding protein [Planctomycetes bacterium]|nr:RNA-binding protein [Planctomycetota bacterium]
MANKNLFQRLFGRRLPPATAINEEGSPAYELTGEQALAQLAATGCLNGTFYATEQEQLDAVLELVNACEPGFVARVALYAREQGLMKDLPALLCAALAARDGALLAAVFPRVIDNGKMLRSFVQILRSGVAGRRSLGTLPRRLVRDWLAARSEAQLFDAAIGNAPSLGDVIRMVHPKPASPERDQLYRYLLGKPFELDRLPAEAQRFERWKSERGELPDVNFQRLSSLELGEAEWRSIALRATWTTLRMNLNTFERHGVFACAETTTVLAARLADPREVRRARAFPYQILSALQNLDPAVPQRLRTSLEQALEIATEHVPELPGRTIVAVDVSGSMSSPVTGHRKGSTSTVTCRDVAALFAASILRRNPSARVIPFHDRICDVQLDPRASIPEISSTLQRLPSGGTNCSAVLAHLVQSRGTVDTVIYFSDNESWVDAGEGGRSTAMLAQWRKLRRENPRAKLVCIDLQPYRTVQAPVADDVIHVGGFSDQVFTVLRAVTAAESSPDFWVEQIRKIAV